MIMVFAWQYHSSFSLLSNFYCQFLRNDTRNSHSRSRYGGLKIMMLINPNKRLVVNHLSKSFGVVDSLTDINFELEAGEILGIVGQRGAGKSTLVNILSGLYQPTRGKFILDGKQIQLTAASQSLHEGIEIITQTPFLANNLSVLENIFLGREIFSFNKIKLVPNVGDMVDRARELFAEFDVSPDIISDYPGNLSNELRQIVVLVRSFCFPAKLLLIDDILGSLIYERQELLLEYLKKCKNKDMSIIIISDDLKHLFTISDRILVLYQGKQLATRTTSETTPREIVELIVGTNLKAQVTPVIWAFENYHAAQKQTEELKQTQKVLRQSLREQDSLNRQLFERLRNQVDALDQLNLALQDANRRLVTEREAERKSLARELHDQVIQDLLSYTYQLEEIETRGFSDTNENEMQEIRDGLRNVVSTLRQTCSDLRPPTLDSHGLSAAIPSLVHQWSKISGLKFSLDIDPELGRLPETIELSVFRIIQEGLSNVRKHAQATSVNLTLRRRSNASLLVTLTDDGKGMIAPVNLAVLQEEKHFGLVDISERVSLLGGALQVTSKPRGGTEIKIEIPSPYPTL